MMRIGMKIICGNFLCINMSTKKLDPVTRNNCQDLIVLKKVL